MNRKMITLLGLSALLMAGCEEWTGARNTEPRTQVEPQDEATTQTPAVPGEEAPRR